MCIRDRCNTVFENPPEFIMCRNPLQNRLANESEFIFISSTMVTTKNVSYNLDTQSYAVKHGGKRYAMFEYRSRGNFHLLHHCIEYEHVWDASTFPLYNAHFSPRKYFTSLCKTN